MKKILVLFILALNFLNVNAYAKRFNYVFIQLASLKNRKSAEMLYDKVRNDYKNSFIALINGFYAIRVGPFSIKSYKEARKTASTLSQKLKHYGVKPILIETESSEVSGIVMPKSKSKKPKSKLKIKDSKTSIKRVNLTQLYIEKAKVCIGKKDCENAVRYLTLAINQNGGTPKLYTYLGYAYLHLSNFFKAIGSFKQALSIDQGYAEAYEGIGFTYLKLNAPMAAMIALKKAYTIKPNEFTYALNYAISLMELGMYQKAMEEFKKLEAKNPLVPEIYYNEALVYLKEKDYKDAVNRFRVFLSLTKRNNFYTPYRDQVKSVVEYLTEASKCE